MLSPSTASSSNSSIRSFAGAAVGGGGVGVDPTASAASALPRDGGHGDDTPAPMRDSGVRSAPTSATVAAYSRGLEPESDGARVLKSGRPELRFGAWGGTLWKEGERSMDCPRGCE